MFFTDILQFMFGVLTSAFSLLPSDSRESDPILQISYTVFRNINLIDGYLPIHEAMPLITIAFTLWTMKFFWNNILVAVDFLMKLKP